MVEGYGERVKEELRQKELLACWIINHNGMMKKAIKPGQLLKFNTKPDKTPEEIKAIVEKTLAFHKRKFWGLIPDEHDRPDLNLEEEKAIVGDPAQRDTCANIQRIIEG